MAAILKWIFLNEDVWILIKISLKFVPKGPMNNIPALVQIMAWRRRGDKLLFEPMMVSLLMHICINWPQWVNSLVPGRRNYDFDCLFFTYISVIDTDSITCETAIRWKPKDLIDD